MATTTEKAMRLFANWHRGQWCAMYAVQSSGLVKSWSSLRIAVDNAVSGDDRVQLLKWIRASAKRSGGKFKHPHDGRWYYRAI